MKTVKKANKVLKISDEQLEVYLKEGFDEIDDKGKVKTPAVNKTYTVAEVDAMRAADLAKIAELERKLKNKSVSD